MPKNTEHTGMAAVVLESLGIGYFLGRDRVKELVSNISVRLDQGDMVCLLGSNGSGKSTLIRTICGLQPKLGGKIFIEGKQLKGWNKNLAQQVGVVLTDIIHGGNLTVYDVVSMGRYPHINWMGTLSNEDHEMIMESIVLVGLPEFSNRRFDSLSDGEKQRVMIAKALAQDTRVIMLDEPTAHLDISNRVEIVNLLATLAHQKQKAILLSIHDLELALRMADRIWLLQNKKLFTGAPEDLILSGLVADTFKGKAFYFDSPSGTFRINRKKMHHVYFDNSSLQGLWTRYALERIGCVISENRDEKIKLNYENNIWELKYEGELSKFKSIETLTKCLRAMFEKKKNNE